MSFNKAAIFRNIGAGVLCLLGIVACERDLEDIAVDLAGQRPFGTGDSIIEVVAYNVSKDSNRTDNNNINKIPLLLYGVNRDSDFGLLKSKMISQVYLPIERVDFGTNPVIDEVVVNLPYFARLDGQKDAVDPETGDPITDESGDTIQVPNFILDSVYGNRDLEFQVQVFELGTFLNTLDPADPTKLKSYYSNRDFELNDQLYDGQFKVNANDTVLYVERRFLDGDPNTVDDIDTIKQDPVSPAIKFRLDKEFFKRKFVDHDNPQDFDNNDNFVRYFRGLYFDAIGADGALMNLTLASATLTIYYSNDQIFNEADGEDLNFNGITGEDGVVVKTKRTLVFPFGGVLSAVYDRDYSGTALQNYLFNPDKINGERTLYVQGASGSEAVIQLFTDEDLEKMRQKNWLINEANLVFYLNGEQSKVPNQLFLYKDDFNSFVIDYYDRRFGPEVFGGVLEYDSNGNPERYKFRITEYVSEVLKSSDPAALSRLALKNYVRTDPPDFTRLDTVISDWNFDPKGVILHGNRGVVDDKRIVLEIYYSNNP